MDIAQDKLTEEEFERWVEASHNMFEIFEARFDVYPLSLRWTQEWFENGKFIIKEGDVRKLNESIDNLDYGPFRNFRDKKESDDEYWKALVRRIDEQFKPFMKNYFHQGEYENIGFGIIPYLFIWNFQRFKEYFKKLKNFNLKSYFESLGCFLNSIKGELEHFKNKELVSYDIEDERIRQLFEKINDKLKGIGTENNEPVGTTKLLHIHDPSYFPLIDNNIAKSVGLKGRMTSEFYLKWMYSLKNWLQNYVNFIKKSEEKFGYSILKLVDQGFYVMSSVNLSRRMGKLGVKVN